MGVIVFSTVLVLLTVAATYYYVLGSFGDIFDNIEIQLSTQQTPNLILKDGMAVVETYEVFNNDIRVVGRGSNSSLCYLVALDPRHTLYVDGRFLRDVGTSWPCSKFEVVWTREMRHVIAINCLGGPIGAMRPATASISRKDQRILSDGVVVLFGSIENLTEKLR
ncbi:MAG: hypothetical protein P4L33_19640 [Capsulimonadaceae bacterium]|nr:hypothetical protein [Capsulimonadaceae bacterium]